MEIPRVGDTFHLSCPFCSPEKPVLHAVFRTTAKGKKHAVDVLCTNEDCFKTSVGSFNPEDDILYVTWLDYQKGQKPAYVKTDQVKEVQFSKAWEERLSSRPYPTAEDEQNISSMLVELLDKHQFASKGELEFALARAFPQFAEVNLSYTNLLRLSFPLLPNIAKGLRMKHAIPFAIREGRHIYGQGKEVKTRRKESQDVAWQILCQHVVVAGPIDASVLVYIPTQEERMLDHFFQAIIPEAELYTAWGPIMLQCYFREKKALQAHFQLDQANCSFTVLPNLLEVSGRFQERYLSRSLIKLLFVALDLSREITCAAHQSDKLLQIFGRANFPATFIIKNSLHSSEEVWQTRFTNIHRTFYSFPDVYREDDYSISERVILNHKAFREFSPEQMRQHLDRFRIIFLRDVVSTLDREEIYIPTTLLRVYAPKGDEAQQLVQDLTTLYEERLKKSQLERFEREREMKLFINRSNLWLSVIILLFSFANVVQSAWLNWTVLGFAGLFIVFILYKDFVIRTREE